MWHSVMVELESSGMFFFSRCITKFESNLPLPFTLPLTLLVHSLPHPGALRHSLSATESRDTDAHLIVTVSHITCTLVPTDTDCTPFGQCLCVAWMPHHGHGKVAAGFSNGMCVHAYMYMYMYVQILRVSYRGRGYPPNPSSRLT